MASAAGSAKQLDATKSASSIDRPPGLHMLWPVVFVALYWLAYAGIGLFDLPMFTTFLYRLAVLLLLGLTLTIWWFTNRHLGWKERLLVPGVTLASAIVATTFLHKTVMPPSVMIPTAQALLTAWTLWLVLARTATPTLRQAGLLAMGVLFWIPMTQVRMEGMRGDGAADLFWRWTPTAEDKLLAAIEQQPSTTAPAGEDLQFDETADWPEFRGPQRSGIVRGVEISTDWKTAPPQKLWSKPVGPAWSSFAVVGDRIFTQEQRGPLETTICYDAATGETIWEKGIAARPEELETGAGSLGGIGPRATPTFAGGKIFTQGASGWLVCYDAQTGDELWKRNIADIAGTELPVWGYSSSPLFHEGLIFTFAGDKPKSTEAGATDSKASPGLARPGLLALRAADGEVVWNAAIGNESYSSPQLVTLHDVPQLLYLSDTQLVSLEPATGKQLWAFKNPSTGRPTVQPQVVPPNQLVISFSPDLGVSLLQIGYDEKTTTWSVGEKWASRNLKPDFSDYVHYDGYLYGFDNDIFACISLADGGRQWKRGRYGAGQVLLLADQPVLLVITERGEATLVATNPQKHEELAKFAAIKGKTWNHPVVSHGKLFVRNAEELACFDVSSSN
jgi:hypothetical protein